MEQNKENKERYGIIYKITNTVNGKVYIGQTTNKRGFKGRYDRNGSGVERVYNYNRYYKNNMHLLNSIEKYGLESFEVDEEFKICYSKEELDYFEKYYISLYNSTDSRFGYNSQEGGLSRKPNEETRRLMSKIVRDRCEDPEYIKKMSECQKGKKKKKKNPM